MTQYFAGKCTNIGRILLGRRGEESGRKKSITVDIAYKRKLWGKKKPENIIFPPAKIHIPSLMLMWQFPCTLVCSRSRSSAHTSARRLSNSWSKAVKGHQPCSVSVPGGSLLWQNATLPEQLFLAPEAEEIFPIWTVKLSFPIWCCLSMSSILKSISVFALFFFKSLKDSILDWKVQMSVNFVSSLVWQM